MQNVMLDLETMGTNPNAPVLAIGAVFFDRTGHNPDDKFYQTIMLESSMAMGGVIDPATVIWWMRQNIDARKQLTTATNLLVPVLLEFSAWVKRPNVVVWGNGADFDNVILKQAYYNARLDLPWGRYNNRCYRTLKNLVPHVSIERLGTHHNALDDAVSQAEHAAAIMRWMGL